MKQVFIAALCVIAVGAIVPAALTQLAEAKETKSASSSDSIRRIEWTDLTPPLSAEAQQAAAELNMRIDQMTDQEIAIAMDRIQAEGDTLMTELDDKNVELEGFLVPIDFDAETVTDFVLVPWFGACIHVPPPPPNQIVFVKYPDGIPMSEIEENFYTPFKIKGKIKAARAKTDLAEVGYQMTASDVEVGKQE